MTRIALLTAAAATCLAATAAQAADRAELLVPAYFYPAAAGSDWDRLTAAVRQGVSVTAIVNPASGPGSASNADYAAAIRAFRAAGGKVLGYVPSGYIGRAPNAGSSCQPSRGSAYSANDVVACAARYQAYYSIDGIFVDEMGFPAGGAPEPELVTFYTAVFDGITAVNKRWEVFGNPGVNPPEALLRRGDSGGAHVIVSFENVASAFAGSTRPDWAGRYKAKAFANILLETGPDFGFAALLDRLAERQVGYVYATDDKLPNPYDRLPADWDRQVASVQSFNAKGGNQAK